jgi:ubiquinone/menaquinone biosynthesis C-methylase UbiE
MNGFVRKFFFLPAILFWGIIRVTILFLNKKERRKIISWSHPYKSYFRPINTKIFSQYNKMELEARKLIKKYPLLDVGCGSGNFLKTLEKNGKCIGIDIFKNGSIADGDFMFIKCDGRHMAFKEGTFNTLFAEFSLHHIKRIDLTIKEAARVLKKGGKMVIIEEQAPKNILLKYICDLNSSWWREVKEWKKLFLNNGFSQFKCKTFKFFTGNKYLFEVVK